MTSQHAYSSSRTIRFSGQDTVLPSRSWGRAILLSKSALLSHQFLWPYLARIIHVSEDKESLICYKHVVETVFEAANEASECLTIAQHSVCCSPVFFAMSLAHNMSG